MKIARKDNIGKKLLLYEASRFDPRMESKNLQSALIFFIVFKIITVGINVVVHHCISL